MERGQSWVLVAIAGSLKGQRFPLKPQRLTVGREETNGLVLPDDNVSRRHLELHVQDGRVVLTDLGSRNGTFINNKRISGIVMMSAGDRLALGSHLLEVQSAPAEAPAPSRGRRLDDDDKTVVQPATGQGDWMSSPDEEVEDTHGRPVAMAAPAPSAAYETRFGLPTAVPAPMRESTLRVDDDLFAPDAPPAPVPEEATIVRARKAPERLASEPRHLSADALRPESSRRARATEVAAEASPAALEMQLGPSVAVGYAGALALDDAPPAPPAPAEDPEERRSRNTMFLIGIGATVMMAMMGVIIVLISQGGPPRPSADAASARPRDTTEVSGDVGGAAGPAGESLSELLSGAGATSLTVGAQAYQLTAEEKALPAEERAKLSQEVFDEAVSFSESERWKEALTGFNHALALDGSCDICMIRANKVAQEIRTRIEKYNSEGLRYFEANQYEKAERSWERALLLLDDPQSPVGLKIQAKMAEARQQQARQSYR